jgi:hypothetical protein
MLAALILLAKSKINRGFSHARRLRAVLGAGIAETGAIWFSSDGFMLQTRFCSKARPRGCV